MRLGEPRTETPVRPRAWYAARASVGRANGASAVGERCGVGTDSPLCEWADVMRGKVHFPTVDLGEVIVRAIGKLSEVQAGGAGPGLAR